MMRKCFVVNIVPDLAFAQSTKRIRIPSVANSKGDTPTESRMKIVWSRPVEGFGRCERNWQMLPMMRMRQRRSV